MKEIKTIYTRAMGAPEFDDEVNAALRKGWCLIRREVLMPRAQPNDGATYFHPMLYAELERGDTPEEESLASAFKEVGESAMEAVEALKATVASVQAYVNNMQAVAGDVHETDQACYCQDCKHMEALETDEPCVACTGGSYWEPKDEEPEEEPEEEPQHVEPSFSSTNDPVCAACKHLNVFGNNEPCASCGPCKTNWEPTVGRRCGTCKHAGINAGLLPCSECIKGVNLPHWELSR